MTTPPNDFDSPWKDATDEYLQGFFALFHPNIHADIDWSRLPVFLDKEFQRIMRGAAIGRRVVDRLVRVWLRDGQSVRVLVHIEVQSQEEAGFSRRMYIYNYRIFDRYDQPIVSLALLPDEQPTWRPDEYTQGFWGCSLQFRYPVTKLTDWRARREELEQSDNPLAVFVLAHLAAQDTQGDIAARQQRKLRMVRRLYDRGYDRERIVSLFRFIDWFLALPAAAEAPIRQAIAAIEEERAMAYVTSIERIGREEGLTQGREEGLTQGLTQGRVEGKRATLQRLVRVRFGGTTEALEQRIAAADETALDDLLDRVVVVTSLEDL